MSDLENAFKKFGEIKDVYLPRDFHTKQPRGFAYIKFSSKTSAENAVASMNGVDLDGRALEVTWAAGSRKSSVEMRKLDRRASPPRRRRSRSRSRDRSRRSRSRYRSFSHSVVI